MLFAWELGGGLGHLARLAPWVSRFSGVGVTPLLAARDLHAVGQMPDLATQTVLQAPGLRHGPFQAGLGARSYPEILLEAGFGNAATLAALVSAWRSLFQLGKIDALVADFSPVAMLAARAARIPVLHVGDGYTIPPASAPGLSPPHEGATGAEAVSRNSVPRVLDCVNRVLSAAGQAPIGAVGAVLEAESTVLATYPELDHHRGFPRSTPYSGHFGGPERPDSGWRPLPGPRILAYLKPTVPEFEATVEVLRRLPAQTRIYASGLVRNEDHSPGFGLTWHAEPVAFASAVRDADLVVSNAGHGATCASLLAGKPMCLLPTVHEQLLTARNVEALGAGELLLQVRDPKRIRRAIARALEDPGLASSAQGFAARHAVTAADPAVRLAEFADRFLGLVKAGEAT